jgi:hypothetical protein
LPKTCNTQLLRHNKGLVVGTADLQICQQQMPFVALLDLPEIVHIRLNLKQTSLNHPPIHSDIVNTEMYQQSHLFSYRFTFFGPYCKLMLLSDMFNKTRASFSCNNYNTWSINPCTIKLKLLGPLKHHVDIGFFMMAKT